MLGVFGLSQYTTERDLRDMFGKYGRIKDIQVVIDKKTNKSRGFGFIYYDEVESAVRVSISLSVLIVFHTRSSQAKEALNATEVDHHRLRIDYSVTKRAHTPSQYSSECVRSIIALFRF